MYVFSMYVCMQYVYIHVFIYNAVGGESIGEGIRGVF